MRPLWKSRSRTHTTRSPRQALLRVDLLEDRVQPNNLLALSGSVFGDTGSGLQAIDIAPGTDFVSAVGTVQVQETVHAAVQDSAPAAPSSTTQQTNPSAVDSLFRVDNVAADFSLNGSAVTQQSRSQVTSADIAAAGQKVSSEIAPAAFASNGSLTSGITPAVQPVVGGSHQFGPGWVTHTPIPATNGLSQTTTVASLDGSTVYVVGGGLGGGPDVTVNTLLAYDTASDTWSTLAPIPSPLRAFGAAVDTVDPISGDETIYVFGGFNGAAPIATLYKYDVATDSWSTGTAVPNSPGGRFGAAVALLNDGSGQVLVAGGAGSSLFNDAYLYDTNTDTYTAVASMPMITGQVTYRIHAASNDDGSQVHVFAGGFAGTGHWVYDVGSNTWSTAVAQIPNGPTDPGVVNVPGTGLIYVVGAPGGSPTTVHSTQIYDTSSNTWSFGPDQPSVANNTSAALALNADGVSLDIYQEGGYNGTGSTPVNISLTVA